MLTVRDSIGFLCHLTYMSNALPKLTALRARGYSTALFPAAEYSFNGDLVVFKLAMGRTVTFTFAGRMWREESPEGEMSGTFDPAAAARLAKRIGAKF